MSATSLTQAQVQQIEAVAVANNGNPAAVWAALSTMGDQYAQWAYQALTNPQSTYGQVVANSLLVSGVSQNTALTIEDDLAQAYVTLIKNGNINSDGTISLPTTTQIENNYVDAFNSAGVPAATAMPLSIAVLAQSYGWTNGAPMSA